MISGLGSPAWPVACRALQPQPHEHLHARELVDPRGVPQPVHMARSRVTPSSCLLTAKLLETSQDPHPKKKKKSFEPLGWASLSHRTRAKLEPSECPASNKPAELCLHICRGGFGSPGTFPAAGAARAQCPCPHPPEDSLPAPKLSVKSAWKENGILRN